jgi:Xaa-Pro aminopeptidase
MRERLEIPRLSLGERDRRWALVRGEMRRQGLDCLVLCGLPCEWDSKIADARYLSPVAGNAEFNFLVFPLVGEPTSFILMPTFLEYWARVQDWVKDIRQKKGTWANSLVGRIRELGLENKHIGVDGLPSRMDPDGWFPYSTYQEMTAALPEAAFVNLDDTMERIRMVKSPEEIGVLEESARLGDRMLEACRETARPGIRECEVYGRMMEAMIGNGGEEPTLFLWAADPHPLPHPFRLPTMRPLEQGDLIVCEMHPKYGGYCTHVERTFCLGQPEEGYRRIYAACLEAYARGMELFTPGANITEAMNAIREIVDRNRLGVCELGIHGHGISSMEYPRYRLHAPPGADKKALAAIGDRFQPGMVFAFNIDLVDPGWREGQTGCVFAETVLITDGKARRMHRFPMDLQIIDG